MRVCFMSACKHSDRLIACVRLFLHGGGVVWGQLLFYPQHTAYMFLHCSLSQNQPRRVMHAANCKLIRVIIMLVATCHQASDRDFDRCCCCQPSAYQLAHFGLLFFGPLYPGLTPPLSDSTRLSLNQHFNTFIMPACRAVAALLAF